METIKFCKKCKEYKPLSEMVKHSNTKDGYLFKCKKCNFIDRTKIRHPVSVKKQICTVCNIEKPSTEFAKNPRNISGINTRCKKCSNFERREKQYWITSKQNIRNRCKIDPIYHEHIKEQRRNNNNKNHKSSMYRNAKKRALNKNLAFTITKDDIIIPEKCPILNCNFIMGKKGNYEYTSTIDRIDNTKGYTKDNIQIITKKANSMKNSATKQELLVFADWIYKNFK